MIAELAIELRLLDAVHDHLLVEIEHVRHAQAVVDAAFLVGVVVLRDRTFDQQLDLVIVLVDQEWRERSDQRLWVPGDSRRHRVLAPFLERLDARIDRRVERAANVHHVQKS